MHPIRRRNRAENKTGHSAVPYRLQIYGVGSMSETARERTAGAPEPRPEPLTPVVRPSASTIVMLLSHASRTAAGAGAGWAAPIVLAEFLRLPRPPIVARTGQTPAAVSKMGTRATSGSPWPTAPMAVMMSAQLWLAAITGTRRSSAGVR